MTTEPGKLPTGYHEQVIDVKSLDNGTYFIQIRNSLAQVQRFVITRQIGEKSRLMMRKVHTISLGVHTVKLHFSQMTDIQSLF